MTTKCESATCDICGDTAYAASKNYGWHTFPAPVDTLCESCFGYFGGKLGRGKGQLVSADV